MKENDKLENQRSPKNIFTAIMFLFLALLYGVSPIDLIPDMIPLFGWGDDVAVALTSVFYAWRTFYSKQQDSPAKKPKSENDES